VQLTAQILQLQLSLTGTELLINATMMQMATITKTHVCGRQGRSMLAILHIERAIATWEGFGLTVLNLVALATPSLSGMTLPRRPQAVRLTLGMTS
jgi:hypothetical protein